jgi:hypothetical protein
MRCQKDYYREERSGKVSRMFGRFIVPLMCLAAASAFADTVAVTISGNFGTPQGGSSLFDDQNYTVDFVIPDSANPSVTTCCLANVEADYDVTAQFKVPGLGLSLDEPVEVEYNSEPPLATWLNIFSFTGLPVGNYMLLTGFQLDSGALWNGLAGPLGTPVINQLNDAAGSGICGPGQALRHSRLRY